MKIYVLWLNDDNGEWEIGSATFLCQIPTDKKIFTIDDNGDTCDFDADECYFTEAQAKKALVQMNDKGVL